MPCYKPLTGYYAAERGSSGKRGITFDKKLSMSGAPLRLPCGQCIGCRLERSRVWAIRCMNEKRMHKASSFLTLTYDDKYLPEDGSLVKGDLQKFMKRLRHETGKGLRFYGCGEYGSLNLRPHYHVLLFNYDFADKKLFSRGAENDLYTSDRLKQLWPNGHNSIGEVTFESCAYVARYIVDKVTGELAADHYAGRVPEFTVMSRRPGIGHEYYMKYAHEMYSGDFLVVNGKKVKPPRFYDERYAMLDRMSMEELKVARRRYAIARSRADNTPERRRVRETVELKRLAMYKRNV